jgi:hypothetical protein
MYWVYDRELGWIPGPDHDLSGPTLEDCVRAGRDAILRAKVRAPKAAGAEAKVARLGGMDFADGRMP